MYADLLRLNIGLLEWIRPAVAKLQPVARQAATVDITIIEGLMTGYQSRLDLWYRRVFEVNGLWLDATGHVIRHGGHEARLAEREFQLIQFLLDHPHRYFSTAQLIDSAWDEPDGFAGDLRKYGRRVRKVLAALDVPVVLLNRPGRGYSLVFRADQ